MIQGVDYYKEKPIFYSIGDFWFDYYTEDTFLLELQIVKNSDDKISVTSVIHPGVQREGRTEYVGGTSDGDRILSVVNSLSGSARIGNDGVAYSSAAAKDKDEALFRYDVTRELG